MQKQLLAPEAASKAGEPAEKHANAGANQRTHHEAEFYLETFFFTNLNSNPIWSRSAFRELHFDILLIEENVDVQKLSYSSLVSLLRNPLFRYKLDLLIAAAYEYRVSLQSAVQY